MNPILHPPYRPSPLRVILQLIFREKARRGPAAIELDVIAGQCERERTLLTERTTESDAIETRLEHIRTGVAAALTDAATPGVITVAESRAICGELINTSLLAHSHTEQLKGMAN